MEQTPSPQGNERPVTGGHFPVPPPLTPPPPPFAPASSRPSAGGGGRGWRTAAIVLFVVLLLSLGMHFLGFMEQLLLAGQGSPRVGPQLQEVTVKEGKGDSKIAVIDLFGVITGDPLGAGGADIARVIERQLELAEKDEEVKSILLKVDSPGGEVLASDEIYRVIAEFQKRSKKPVVASMGSVAASGGYYVAAPCRWIVANELTITGSIGVVMHGYNYRGLMDKIGLRPEVYKSGKFKDMLSGDRSPEEITPEERRMVQSLVDETYDRFKRVIREGRERARSLNKTAGKELAADWQDFADGRVFSGKEAFRLGFVDELGNAEVAIKAAERLGGTKDASLVQYLEPFDLSHFLRLFGRSQASTIKLELGPEQFRLRPGHLYFIAPTFVR